MMRKKMKMMRKRRKIMTKNHTITLGCTSTYCSSMQHCFLICLGALQSSHRSSMMLIIDWDIENEISVVMMPFRYLSFLIKIRI